MDDNRKIIAAAAAAFMAAGVAFGAYWYTKRSPAAPAEPAAPDAKATPAPEETKGDWEGFTDPQYKESKYLSRVEAFSRSELVSDVNYTIALGLIKGG